MYTYMYLHVLVALGLCSVDSDYMMFKLLNYFFLFSSTNMAIPFEVFIFMNKSQMKNITESK